MKKEKNNKGLIVLIIMLILIILGLIGFVLYDKLQNDKDLNNNQPSDKDLNNTYKLKKYSDFDGELDSIDFVDFYQDYIIISQHNLDNKSTYVFKDGKLLDIPQISNLSVNKKIGNNNYYANVSIDKSFLFSIENITDETKYFECQWIIPLYDNTLIVKKDNKFGLSNGDGTLLTKIDYDYMEDIDYISKYLFVEKNGKIGIMNYKGEIIVPINYDYETKDYNGSEYKYYGKTSLNNENVYFILKKNNEYNVINEKNEIILKSKNEISYSENLNYFEIKENNKSYYYSLNGKLINSIEHNSDWNEISYISSSITNDMKYIIFQSKSNENTLYLIDNKIKVSKLENVYFNHIDGANNYINNYYITNDYYISKQNDKYVQYSLNSKEKINEFSYVKNIELNSGYTKTKYHSVLIACKDSNKCGVISNTGDILYDFKYSISKINYEIGNHGSITLKNGREKLLLSSGFEIKKIVCDNELEGLLPTKMYSKIVRLSDGNLYDENCIIINEKKIGSFIEAGNYLIAEISESENVYNNYYIYDVNGKQIKYENPDNVTLKKYIGTDNNKIYFLTTSGIYYITN